MQKRTYKIQKVGGSFYLALPPSIVSEAMLALGVDVEVMHYDGLNLILSIKVSAESGEHAKDNKQGGENAP